MKISILFLLFLLGAWAFVAVGTVPPPKYRVTVDLTQDSLPPPSVEEVDTAHVYKIVEEMPLFKTCPDVKTKEKRKECLALEWNTFISKNIKYPCASCCSFEGTVVVRFVVERDGVLSNFKILKDPGFGFGKEVLRVVQQMPAWESPGMRGGYPVRVQYTLPVRFKL